VGPTRIAHVVMPRPDALRPVLEFAWAATRALREDPRVETRTLIPVPRSAFRRWHNRARAFKEAAPWPEDLEGRLRMLEPTPELVPFGPRPGRSLESATRAVARALGTWPDRLLGSILDEAGYVAARVGHRLRRPAIAVAHGSDARAAARGLGGPGQRARWTASHAARIVAVSEHLADVLAELAPRPVVVPFTVFARDFAPAPPPDPELPTRLVFVGRLSRPKGVDRLLRALARTTDGELFLELVGPVVRGFDASALARELGVSHRVRFLGSLSQGDLQPRYAQAHAVVLPSREEGLGNVLLEGLLVGRPLVASDVGGVPEVVTPDVGIRVASGDSAAWAEALVALRRGLREGRWDPSRLRRHAEAFTWESQGPRLVDVLKVP